MTKEQVEKTVINAGFKLGVSWEDEHKIYASSLESYGAVTYGHPRFEAMYYRDSSNLVVVPRNKV